MIQVQPGSLLVATAGLVDPNFADSVVLILDIEDDGGALGVVLNQPSEVPVLDVLGDWSDLASEPSKLFFGGPVGRDGALAVGRLSDEQDAPVGWRPVFGACGMVDLDTPTELVEGTFTDLRVFAGYAGWGSGQLKAEVEEGSWYVVDGLPGDVFRPTVDSLWRDVMRRQPGELAWVSTRPADVTQN